MLSLSFGVIPACDCAAWARHWNCTLDHAALDRDGDGHLMNFEALYQVCVGCRGHEQPARCSATPTLCAPLQYLHDGLRLVARPCEARRAYLDGSPILRAMCRTAPPSAYVLLMRTTTAWQRKRLWICTREHRRDASCTAVNGLLHPRLHRPRRPPRQRLPRRCQTPSAPPPHHCRPQPRPARRPACARAPTRTVGAPYSIRGRTAAAMLFPARRRLARTAVASALATRRAGPAQTRR